MGGQLISPREFIFGIFAAGLVGIAAYATIGYFAASDWPHDCHSAYPISVGLHFHDGSASYSSRASIWDVGFALLFGLIGYAMRRTNFSAAAFIIAFVLTSV